MVRSILISEISMFFLALILSLTSHAGTNDWKVTHDWSPSLDKKFSEFIQTIGESKCRSLDACLKSPVSNPYYAARTPKDHTFDADCAYYPYALRMYFAWMEGLPFDYVSKVAPADPAHETQPDIRYTVFGNKPAGRRTIGKGVTTDALQEFKLLRAAISTATYRMHYREISDFYPPIVSQAEIRPGTAVYDPSGHAAIVFKIEADGRIRMMDAHPDNSVTRITFDQKFIRSNPVHGGGIKNWRPELNLGPTDKLTGFSAEQYSKVFHLGKEAVSFYDFVRAQMAGGLLSFTPVTELKNMMLEACSNVHDREAAVNSALASGVQNERHPDRLPTNIYGTSGDWESNSSPSRDARLKVAFVEIRSEMERFLTMYRQKSPRIVYQPTQSKYSPQCSAGANDCLLAASLMSSYEEAVKDPSCIFQYTNGNGAVKKLSYTDIVGRLFKLSFDPYHCVESRWGAATKDEASSCRDDSNKAAWYAAEQNLRNQTDRTYDARMDADLAHTPQLGTPKAPEVDLWGYLGRQLK
jgi:hypothetical protein